MIFFFIFFIIINLVILSKFSKISNFFPYDHFDYKRKKNYKKVPLAGGFLFLLNLLLLFFLSKINNFYYFDKPSSILIFYSIMFFLVGFLDDKFNLSPYLRSIIQLILIIHFFGVNNDFLIKKLEFLSINLEINISSYSLIFSVLALFLFINAMNMFDGLNGQVTAYSIFFLTVLYYKDYQTGLIVFLIIFLITFFLLNIKSKAYLGSSGVLLISFILGYFVIDGYQKKVIYSDEIFLLMLIPGLDMIRLFFVRLISKKNPLVGDNNHIHHHLVKIFSPVKTFLIILFFNLFLWSTTFFVKQYISIIVGIILYIILISGLSLININKYGKRKKN